jgi:hypothetical protein
MSKNTNDELPDDLLDRLRLLNEQPDDYHDNIGQMVPLREEDIGTFRPPERALRIGVRPSSYENYQAWGFVSEDFRILMSDEGEVYVKVDEETFGATEAIQMMLKMNPNSPETHARRHGNINIGLRAMLGRRLRKNVVSRLCSWLSSGRLGSGTWRED